MTKLLQPTYVVPNKPPRYYQEIAINRAVRRILITMATGTGKTLVAFQIAWKLWSAGWNVSGHFSKPKILRDDNRDTYAYFGDPIYTYGLAQGIEDGFLAPCPRTANVTPRPNRCAMKNLRRCWNGGPPARKTSAPGRWRGRCAAL